VNSSVIKFIVQKISLDYLWDFYDVFSYSDLYENVWVKILDLDMFITYVKIKNIIKNQRGNTDNFLVLLTLMTGQFFQLLKILLIKIGITDYKFEF